MAPTNGAPKGRKAGAGITVVPAIPLPYVKRQAAAAAAAATSPSAKANASANATNTDSAANSVATPLAGAAELAADKDHVNGAVQKTDATKTEPSSPISSTSKQPSADDHSPTSPVAQSESQTSTAPSVGPAPAEASPQDNKDTGKEASNMAGETGTRQPISDTSSATLSAPNGNGVADNESYAESKHTSVTEPPPAVQGIKSRPPPPISPSRYQMPPPFQPAGRPSNMISNRDLSHGPRPLMPNGPPIHQAHPSNGSVHFGAFHGSDGSSPAPPHSGGIAPPPGMQLPDGRQPFLGPGSNGFPPIMPSGVDGMPMFDSYGRPMGYGPMESYPAYNNGHGPSATHSYHGSQSSMPLEENAMYGQFPVRGGGGMMSDEGPPNQQGRVFGAPDLHMPPPPGYMVPPDDADGLTRHLQQQFGHADYSDCILELRFLHDRAPPVRVPGHRVILSRSPRLAQLVSQQHGQPLPTDQAHQIILLETDSKWIRADAFYMAAQRLYGAALLPIPPPRNSVQADEMVTAGTPRDQFEFALAYAAAGHLLQWAPVVRRGCEIAIRLLDWDTMETALEFSLEDYDDRGTHDAHKYRDGSKMLLHAIVTFIIHNLAPTFNIDTTVPEPPVYSRLPSHPVLRPTSSDGGNGGGYSPTIVRGTSAHMANGRRSRNLSNIQFGDLSLADSNDESASETPRPTQPAHPVSHALLSRVLLNLPFPQLKMILESSGSGNVRGWANTESRYRIIKDAVEERERRRLRAVDAVVRRAVADSEMVMQMLQSPAPQSYGKWSTLGWRESILPYGSPDGPSLERSWTPLMAGAATSGAVAEYP